ncbi:MFS transporter [Alicyclobacillus fastidiosus]|uniref:MFS transporter n=1 Tax=Alicyclobacillus fastidiosus TaxID=392011 RepID=A0ABY6ZIB3_9BACL|nr:MFS transporter [Alicyclobacillus fastidiosus]WAH42597.1 MFS transporter [Alicyclobacillus fastidiosus]GMA64460.1 MFS transporter [Alicyclobacillus fastidiosus]
MSANPSHVNLLSRLERIPVTRTVIYIIVLLSFVWLAEAFDIGIVGPVLTTLEKTWGLASWQQGLLAVASTLGVVTGMIPSGLLADRIGRRRVVLFGILFFSVLTLVGSVVSNFSTLWLIRFLAGVGEGAVLPMPYLLLSEFVRSRQRAVSVGYSNGILTAAYVIPNLASLWALNTFPASFAWRVPFLLGGIPLLLLIPLALWLPESPRYLLKRGREAEVVRLVERLEGEAGLTSDLKVADARIRVVLDHAGEEARVPFRAMVAQPFLRRGLLVTLQLTAALILFYILQVFGPTLLVSRGTGNATAILFSGLMMVVAGIGSIAQGYLSDKLGRKAILAMYVMLASAGCLLFAFGSSTFSVFLAGALTAFFGLGIFPVSKLCVAEQYPTELRGRGVYLNEMTARTVSGVVTIYFIPFLLHTYGNQMIFFGIAVVLVLLNLPFLFFGRETANVQMEEAGATLSFGRIEREALLHQVSSR